MKKVSYQGVQGAYSQSAAKKFFGEEIATYGTFTFKDALKSAQDDKTPSDVNHCWTFSFSLTSDDGGVFYVCTMRLSLCDYLPPRPIQR